MAFGPSGQADRGVQRLRGKGGSRRPMARPCVRSSSLGADVNFKVVRTLCARCERHGLDVLEPLARADGHQDRQQELTALMGSGTRS
ncbi:MAG: hypothetical protein ACLTG4_11025 [Oscillospiraceae bacterium]